MEDQMMKTEECFSEQSRWTNSVKIIKNVRPMIESRNKELQILEQKHSIVYKDTPMASLPTDTVVKESKWEIFREMFKFKKRDLSVYQVLENVGDFDKEN